MLRRIARKRSLFGKVDYNEVEGLLWASGRCTTKREGEEARGAMANVQKMSNPLTLTLTLTLNP